MIFPQAWFPWVPRINIYQDDLTLKTYDRRIMTGEATSIYFLSVLSHEVWVGCCRFFIGVWIDTQIDVFSVVLLLVLPLMLVIQPLVKIARTFLADLSTVLPPQNILNFVLPKCVWSEKCFNSVKFLMEVSYCFTCCFVWVWNSLASHVKGRTSIEGVWKQGAEENIYP
jgi:hypothetical protein